MTAYLQLKLDQRRLAGNLRMLKAPRALIDFSSSDYLGIARSQELPKKVQKALDTFQSSSTSLNGFGATGSRLLTGHHIYTEILENQIANFHGFESALLFNCGYMANLGLISAVAQNEDIILYDIQVHASTHDGIRLSRAESFPLRHNDLEHLEKRLKNLHARQVFVCVESVYSTDGSIAPLQEIVKLCEQYQARLIVDEAHAVGLFGNKGEGLSHALGLTPKIFAQVTTFGKAMGVHGAVVLGSSTLKEYLINFARSFIYTTALPLHSLFAIASAYALLPELQKERAHLQNLIQIMGNSSTAIQPIYQAGNQPAKNLQKFLEEAGFDSRSLLSPTVPKGKEMIRMTLHSYNTLEEVYKFKKAIATFQEGTL